MCHLLSHGCRWSFSRLLCVDELLITSVTVFTAERLKDNSGECFVSSGREREKLPVCLPIMRNHIVSSWSERFNDRAHVRGWAVDLVKSKMPINKLKNTLEDRDWCWRTWSVFAGQMWRVLSDNVSYSLISAADKSTRDVTDTERLWGNHL